MVIGVAAEYRRMGIGEEMITRLAEYAAVEEIPRISLMVAKDNVAWNLYRKQHFNEYEDRDTDLTMIRDTSL